MKKISKDVYVGTVDDLATHYFDPQYWSIVNLSSVYHKRLHNWEYASPNHPCYVVHETERLFSLNWVDGPAMYFDYQGKGAENTRLAIGFIEKALMAEKSVFICCDKGMSRSPSIALLWLAFGDMISKESYEKAKEDFMKWYPDYKPGEGIQEFLSKQWKQIIL